MDIEKLGWNGHFDKLFRTSKNEGTVPARVITQQGSTYSLAGEFGEIGAQLTGRYRYHAHLKKDYPAVGDWVGVELPHDGQSALIHVLLERRNCFARKLPISGGRKIRNDRIDGGSTEEQVIAANIDVAFIVSGLDGDVNPRRLERYLTLVRSTGAAPVILLNKTDLCERVDDFAAQVREISRGAAVHPLSVVRKEGVEALQTYLAQGRTAIFIGSSGVGKSTIINFLLGSEQQRTGKTNESTGKGRHTTTSRQLLLHPGGGVIIDTPGLRELQLWASEEDVESGFDDVLAVIRQCKFSDCRHGNEPGCALRRALADGTIRPERYAGYQAQMHELRRLEQRRKEFAVRMGQKKTGRDRRLSEDEFDR